MQLIEKLIDLDRKTRKRIAVIGEAMTDIYVHGHLEVGQEGCPKFVEEFHRECKGGSANAAKSLSRWNVTANCYSQIPSSIIKKTRFLVNGKTLFRYDEDGDLTDNQMLRVIDKELRIFDPHAILISDYDKRFLTPEFIKNIIDFAKRNNIPVVADAKREPTIYQEAILKCNEEYALRTWGTITPCDWTMPSISCCPAIVVTNGSRQPFIAQTYQDCQKLEDRKNVACVNNVGAGDCFAAHMTMTLAHDFSLKNAVSIANSAGRIYVQHEHNRAPYPFEIAKDMDHIGKIVTGEQLKQLRRSIRGRLIWTNGVFRVPHAGHAWLMRWAKTHGDVLVVGINSDAGAARIRPGEFITPLEERIEILAAMDAVDWIVVFDGPDPIPEIELIRPNAIVKGSEYKDKRIFGSELVKEIHIAPDQYQRCASGLVAEIVENSRSGMHADYDC